MSVRSLDHLVLTVADLEASIAFYTTVMGMKAELFHPADGTTRHALKFGEQKINLHPESAPYAPHAARPVSGSMDLCFLSDVPLDEWRAHLLGHGIEPECGPVLRTGATGAIVSIYFRDPDDNLIEVANKV